MGKPTHAKPSLYAQYFEILKPIAKDFGYNLVLHGSMARDLDLILIPWVDDPRDEFECIQKMSMEITGFQPANIEAARFSVLPGGRNSYTIDIERGGSWNHYVDTQCYIDISVTPTIRRLSNNPK